MDQRVAGRYAQALFNAAEKAGAIGQVENDLGEVLASIEGHPALHAFLMSPVSDRRKKSELLAQLFGASVSPLVLQALRLMVDKRREAEIRPMYAKYQELRREHDNVLHVKVSSKAHVPDDVRTRLTEKLGAQTGKRIEAEYELDPHMIGGIRVAYDNYVLDGTVRGRLARLRDKLKSELRSA
ncbi:MAG: ATP synthase F1 subunit delta [Fimbriimonadaceae bacterium]|nr:ATP synthase F1 subunit delta [Fimbriimonadaceae bacterium]